MDVLSLYKIKAIPPPTGWNLLQSWGEPRIWKPVLVFSYILAVLRYFTLQHDTTWHFWGSCKKICTGFSARQATKLKNKFSDSSKWWVGSVRRYLFQAMSPKNSGRKMMLKWVFLSIEPFKSLLLQNLLLANSTRYFATITTSCATVKTQILNTWSTSEIKPYKVAVLLNSCVQQRSHTIVDNRSKYIKGKQDFTWNIMCPVCCWSYLRV